MIAPDLLLYAYRHGAFPMALEDGEIGWFSPDPRAIIPLDADFHVPHGLKRTLKKQAFDLKFNCAFDEVIRCCAQRQETWINEEILESYRTLHRLGYAHSVEAWQNGQLAGGLYGVAMGGVFFGESMFHTITDASKVALHGLVTHMRARGFTLLDTQWATNHLRTFGTQEITRSQYLKRLKSALDQPCQFC